VETAVRPPGRPEKNGRPGPPGGRAKRNRPDPAGSGRETYRCEGGMIAITLSGILKTRLARLYIDGGLTRRLAIIITKNFCLANKNLYFSK
jgi:hypothetical protein